MTVTPNFHDYRWIVVNSSGGKDSQVALGVEYVKHAFDNASVMCDIRS